MLEFGETDSLTGGVRVNEVLEKLHDLGIRTAIDHFGHGIGSLAGLLKLPATHLKIDPEFVQDALGGDVVTDVVIRVAVELGRQRDLTVVAVGVPSLDHADALAKLGVHAAQGRRFFPPSSLRAISEYLAIAPALPAPDADVISLDSRRRNPSD